MASSNQTHDEGSVPEWKKMEFDPQDLSAQLHSKCVIFSEPGFKLDEVEKVAKSAEVFEFEKSQIILQQHQRVFGVFVVLEGKIQGGVNNETIDYNIDTMDFFGIECLFKSYHFSEKTFKSVGVSKVACEYSQN